MRKILMIQNNSGFSNNVFEFVKKLNEAEQVMLTCFFLPELSSKSFQNEDDLGALHDNQILITDDVNDFIDKCKKNNICCKTIAAGYDDYMPKLIRETVFSDLLLIGKNILTYILNEDDDNELLVHTAECPILVIPERKFLPANVILAYDGKPSSAYAVKEFSYLLPEYTKLPTFLAYADYKDRDVPYRSLIEELTQLHFTDLTISKIDMVPEKYITTWLIDRPDSLLVTGAFDRTTLSELFKKSFVWNIINECDIPIFIAH